MKAVRQLCTAIAMTLVFTLPVFAGNMPTPVAAPTPPPQETTTADGHMGRPISTDGEIHNPLAQMAVQLVQGVLALF